VPKWAPFAPLLLQIMVLALCAGCQTSLFPNEKPASEPSGNVAVGSFPNGGHFKTGKPYKIANRVYYPLSTAEGYDRTGIASWYGKDFHGKMTANGERYDMHALSAAHPTLPLPTLARVTNLENGKQVIVRVNDRGPFVKNRLIDLSYSAAVALGFSSTGTTRVRVQALSGNPDTFAVDSARERHMRDAPVVYIQAGAFTLQSNALKLKARLQSRFPGARIETSFMDHRQWFRVRIGPVQDTSEIERTLLSLQNDMQLQPIVVTEQ